jgi:hypothetical protein
MVIQEASKFELGLTEDRIEHTSDHLIVATNGKVPKGHVMWRINKFESHQSN